MLELLGGPTSTCCCKVHLTGFEKGLEIVEREINVHKHQNLTPEYIAMNRDGMVPTLLHDGRVVVESSVIMRYLDRCFLTFLIKILQKFCQINGEFYN